MCFKSIYVLYFTTDGILILFSLRKLASEVPEGQKDATADVLINKFLSALQYRDMLSDITF